MKKNDSITKSLDNLDLTSAEMGKLWATYLGNSMGKYVLSYFLKHVDDKNIKKILEFALSLSESFLEDIKAIFVKASFPIPVGFSEEDVNVEAPRLFYDEFYLHYLQYLGKAGMSIYSVAIPLVTKKDVVDFFVKSLNHTVKLMTEVNNLLKEKSLLLNPPPSPPPKRVDFVSKQNFLNGFFGDVRPLHGLEVAHLYGNINNDVTSKALIVGFTQVAKREEVRKYLERGNKINQSHIKMLSEKLNKDNLPAPTLLDHLVTPSTTPPFSDKLMVFHKIDMFSMKMREYANGASLNGRRDIGLLYGRCFMDVALYVEDGANIMIEHGWMEQPPETVDRNKLARKNEDG
jgi:hypothetical protein